MPADRDKFLRKLMGANRVENLKNKVISMWIIVNDIMLHFNESKISRKILEKSLAILQWFGFI